MVCTSHSSHATMGSYKSRNGTERNGMNWIARYSSFIEQTLYFYDSDDITNLFRLLYKKH